MDRKRILILSIILLIFTSLTFVHAYKSTNYTLTNPRILSSGGKASSTNYSLSDVEIGNIIGGTIKSTNYSLETYPIEKRIPPAPATVDPVTSPTNNPIQTLSGTKDKATSIYINGYERVSLDNETTWSCPVNLAEGENTLIVTSKNIYGQESESVIVNIILDTVPPLVAITSPLDGEVINEAPITVTGTINEEGDVLVNTVLATVEGTNFTAEGVDLRYGENTITATAYDFVGNSSTDTITVTSTTTSDYNITKLTSDVYEYDPTTIIAGSQVSLTIRLEIDGLPAANEPIEFLITQGNGSMVQAVVNTDLNGEATGILNTDTDASVTNLVEVFDQNFPDKKVTFHIDTKPGLPAILTKYTDETQTPVPGTTLPLIVKLTDTNNNGIENEQVNFSISQGGGTLSSASAITNYDGIAMVILTTPLTYETLTQIIASLATDPLVVTVFNITTSAPLTVTIDYIIGKVNANDEKIQDIKADITVTSNASFLPPEMHLKIWQKGDKQKVEEISPNPQTKIRPPLEDLTEYIEMQREIISYDPVNNIYAIKTKQSGQIEEYPYQILYIDYDKGVEFKSEYYTKDNQLEMVFTTEAQDFIQIGDAWVFQKLIETAYEGQDKKELYYTENIYSNIQINTGIPDSEFK